jgi:predicted Co/Zn/Cd cation transporter (cation efflux family)
MSEAATNISGVMIASSIPILALGGSATAILWASGYADPTVVGLIAGTPLALAIPVLALSRLVKRTKEVVEAAPPVHHHTYNGNVSQEYRTLNTNTRGVWASTRNQLPK